MTTTKQAQADLHAKRRSHLPGDHIGKWYPTEMGGEALIVATNGRLLISQTGMAWRLVDGVLVSAD